VRLAFHEIFLDVPTKFLAKKITAFSLGVLLDRINRFTGCISGARSAKFAAEHDGDSTQHRQKAKAGRPLKPAVANYAAA
jgi:hypothetical protein